MSKERKDKHFLHKPEYVGGPTAIRQFVTANIQYPAAALEAGIEGTVSLRYDINYKGIVTGAKIISGIGYGCDEEAIRLVKLLKFQVAKNRGVKVIFHKTIKIHFRKTIPQKTTPAPPPTQTAVQYNYTSTSKNETKETNSEDNEDTSYHYTISW